MDRNIITINPIGNTLVNQQTVFHNDDNVQATTATDCRKTVFVLFGKKHYTLLKQIDRIEQGWQNRSVI